MAESEAESAPASAATLPPPGATGAGRTGPAGAAGSGAGAGAAAGVAEGRMTLGDLVLVNAFLIQLYIPLNFLGVVYREIRQALTDIERMMDVLALAPEVADRPGAKALEVKVRAPSG